MRLLFFAVTKRQYTYFKALKQQLGFDAKVLFFPSLRSGVSDLKIISEIDTDAIFATKQKEIDTKYTNNLHRALYLSFLKLQIPWIISVLSSAIRIFNPDMVVFWNGKKFHQAIGVEVAKHYGKRTLFFENGLLPGTTQMDFCGVNASNSVPRYAAFYEKIEIDDRIKLPENLIQRSSKKVQRTFEETLPDHYIFVPFQVAYDTQIIQHSPWIKDMETLFLLLKEITEKTGVTFVLKEHPSDRVSDYTMLHRQVTDKIRFSSLHTQALIENADAVLTINSSVAVESLLLGKRVIVLGEAFFAIEGIVNVAHDKESLLAIIEDLEHWILDASLVQKFVYYLYTTYLIPGDWKAPNKRHIDTIRERIAHA